MEVSPLRCSEVTSSGKHGLHRTEDQRQRCTQFVTDVGEQVAFELVQLPDPLKQLLQLLIRSGDLSLGELLFCDVAPSARRKMILPVWSRTGRSEKSIMMVSSPAAFP